MDKLPSREDIDLARGHLVYVESICDKGYPYGFENRKAFLAMIALAEAYVESRLVEVGKVQEKEENNG